MAFLPFSFIFRRPDVAVLCPHRPEAGFLPPGRLPRPGLQHTTIQVTCVNTGGKEAAGNCKYVLDTGNEGLGK